MSRASAQYRTQEILKADRQQAITEARAKPVDARVFWDFDADAWAIECETCHKGPKVASKQEYPGLTDGRIKELLGLAAEKHNREAHGQD